MGRTWWPNNSIFTYLGCPQGINNFIKLMKKALLFGASGHTGSFLLRALLQDERYSEVIVVLRKELPIGHPKLKILSGDYYSLSELKKNLVADDVFITLGSADKAIDYNYPVLAAKLAKENGAMSLFIITAVGASVQSSILYTKLKGGIEQDIQALDYECTHFFRPSMIMGRTADFRPMEKIMMTIWKIISPLLLGSFKKYRGIEGRRIALAMHKAAFLPKEKINVYHWQEIKDLSNCIN